MTVMAGRGGALSAGVGQVKPDGVPSFDTGDSTASDVLFWALDVGDNTVVDITSNVTMVAKTLPSVVSTPYGKALGWAASNSGGYGYIGASTSAIHTAQDLSAQTTGAGWTLAAAFYGTGAAPSSFIAGRPAHASENQPYANCAFYWENGGAYGAHTVSALINNSLVAADCGGHDIGAYNVFATAVLTAENTAPGVATVKLYVQGALRATTAGLVVQDTGPGYSDSYQDGEEQFNWGTVFHPDTGLNFNSFAGELFTTRFDKRVWSSTEAANFHSAPYDKPRLTW